MRSLIYCFDRYIIDPARREFWDGDERVLLELKVFDTLVYLLEHRDRTVCRDELISAVWGRVDVTDGNLSQVITHARHAVGDNAKKQSVIRTIPRHGYGWVLPVEESHVDLTLNGNGAGQVTHANGHSRTTGASSDIRVQSAVAVSPPLLRKTSRWLAPTLAVMLLVSAVAFWPENGEEAAQSVPTFDQTALVLPVTVVGDRNESWIRLGVMDLIADRLREAGQAVLPSDNTVALARELDPDGAVREPAFLAEAASAGLVLEAEAEAVSDHWQVTLYTRHGVNSPIATQASAPDILAAARMAADHMARRLGHRVPEPAVRTAGEQAAEFLLKRLRAELLAENHDKARALYESAAPELQENPRIRYQFALAEMRDARTAQSTALFESLAREIEPDADLDFYAEIQNGLGYSLLDGFDYPAAEEHYTRALEALGDRDSYAARRTRGSALGTRGAVRYFQGRNEEALADFSRARIALEGTGDHLSLISLDINTGAVNNMMGRTTEAIPYLARAAARAQLFGRQISEIRARQSLINAHLAQLDPESAQAHVPRMRELVAETSSERLRVFSSLILSQVLTANGAYGEVEELFQNLRNAQYRQEIPELNTMMRTAVANHAMNIDDPERAAREARAALRPEWDPASDLTRAQTWLVLVRALIAQGQLDEAGDAFVSVKEWADAVEQSAVQLQVRLMEGELAAATGDSTAARIAFEQALSLTEDERVPGHTLDVVKAYVPFLISQGDLERAGFLAGHTAGWSDRHYDAALVHLRLYHVMADTTAWRMALDRARTLAGEREIPPELLIHPDQKSVEPQFRDTAQAAFAATSAPEGINSP